MKDLIDMTSERDDLKILKFLNLYYIYTLTCLLTILFVPTLSDT